MSDVHAALQTGRPGFVLLDSRSAQAWAQGHVPRALHLPGREIPVRAAGALDRSVPVVTYCWGPGCNGATRAALALASRGWCVREMLGGFEYWAPRGPPRRDGGRRHPLPRRPADRALRDQLRLLSGWFRRPPSGQRGGMWLLLTRRFRLWLLLTVLAPLATGLLRRLGLTLQQRRGPSAVSNALLKAGDLGDRARHTLKGGRKRR